MFGIVEKLKFFKRNYIVWYSLLLIVVVVGVILFGNYYSLSKFEYNTDRLLQSKAILAEDIFNVLVSDNDFSDQSSLNGKISEILKNDSEIKKIEILLSNNNKDGYKIVASSDKHNVGKEMDNDLLRMAFGNDVGIAFLNNDSNGKRYWEVVKVIKNNGKRIGLISFQMSLEEHDNFIKKSTREVYIVLAILMFLVLLIIANHVRFFKYALKATKLEEVDKMKDDFISMASHELKSPLTAIRGYIEILKDSLTTKGKNIKNDNVQVLENMESSASRLEELVSDLLDVSRLQQNRMPINLSKVDLDNVIEGIIKELMISAKNKGLDLIYVKPKNIVEVLADAGRVKQILINLLSNAIKYTPKGKVEITLREDAKNIFVTVADTGLGISAKNLKKLFSKFYRVKTDKTVNISGTGLGLWISREIARKMKGDLTVESIEGVGSHFTLKLKKYKK